MRNFAFNMLILSLLTTVCSAGDSEDGSDNKQFQAEKTKQILHESFADILETSTKIGELVNWEEERILDSAGVKRVPGHHGGNLSKRHIDAKKTSYSNINDASTMLAKQIFSMGANVADANDLLHIASLASTIAKIM